MYIDRLAGCENFVGKREEYIFNAFVQRSEDWYNMRKFRSFNHCRCKIVLNLLKAINLRLRKIVVERVTVVKFRVDNRGSNVLAVLTKGNDRVHGYENSRT